MFKEPGVKTGIITTPWHESCSFGTNIMEAALTAFSRHGRNLMEDELNALIDELELKPTFMEL